MTIVRVTGLDKDNDGLDEIVAHHVSVHMERMACGHMWMQVRDGARELTVNLYQKGRRIIANVEDEIAEPSKFDCLNPSPALLSKVASLVCHMEELRDTGEVFDKLTVEQLRADPEVDQWFRSLKALAMLPIKRAVKP